MNMMKHNCRNVENNKHLNKEKHFLNKTQREGLSKFPSQVGEKCWKISTEEKNWLDAALSCGAENSVLASITMKEEQDKVN